MHRQPESLHWISGYTAPKLRKDCIMQTEYSENLARKDFPARKERKPRSKMSEEERLAKKRLREKE